VSDNTEQGLVTITPLEGGYAPIALTGTALPFKKVNFPTEQRVKSTYYPGNPVATQTVGGPITPNSTMQGHWMDVDLGEGMARQLVLQFELLAKQAIPVEVRWGGRQLTQGTDPAIVRRGIIKRFDPGYNRSQDVEWTCEFEWRGEALQTTAPTFASQFTPSSDFSALNDQLTQTKDHTSSWSDIAFATIGSATSAMLTLSDALDDVQNAIINGVNVVNAATQALSDVANLPSSVADRVRGICDQIINACANGRAAIGSFCGLWPGLGVSPVGPAWTALGQAIQQQAVQAKLALYPTDDPLARLDGQTAQYSLIESWDLLASQAAVASAALASRQVPDVIAILRPPAGSDLRDIAARPEIYGNPDLWWVIADYNNLASSEVPATPTGASDDGAPAIYVPRLTGAEQALIELVQGTSTTARGPTGTQPAPGAQGGG